MPSWVRIRRCRGTKRCHVCGQVNDSITLRDRVWFNDLDDRSHEGPGASYRARLERLSSLPDTTRAIDAVEGVSHRSHLAWKRRFDAVAAFLGLVFLSPLFLLVAALIRFESRGPIFYRSVR